MMSTKTPSSSSKRQFHAASPGSGIVMLDTTTTTSTSNATETGTGTGTRNTRAPSSSVVQGGLVVPHVQPVTNSNSNSNSLHDSGMISYASHASASTSASAAASASVLPLPAAAAGPFHHHHHHHPSPSSNNANANTFASPTPSSTSSLLLLKSPPPSANSVASASASASASTSSLIMNPQDDSISNIFRILNNDKKNNNKADNENSSSAAELWESDLQGSVSTTASSSQHHHRQPMIGTSSPLLSVQQYSRPSISNSSTGTGSGSGSFTASKSISTTNTNESSSSSQRRRRRNSSNSKLLSTTTTPSLPPFDQDNDDNDDDNPLHLPPMMSSSSSSPPPPPSSTLASTPTTNNQHHSHSRRNNHHHHHRERSNSNSSSGKKKHHHHRRRRHQNQDNQNQDHSSTTNPLFENLLNGTGTDGHHHHPSSQRSRSYSGGSDSFDVAEVGHVVSSTNFFFPSITASPIPSTSTLQQREQQQQQLLYHKSSSHSHINDDRSSKGGRGGGGKKGGRHGHGKEEYQDHNDGIRNIMSSSSSPGTPSKSGGPTITGPKTTTTTSKSPYYYCVCCCDLTTVRSTLSYMNWFAKILFWCSVLALAAAVIWYSHELTNKGTDPHLIAWFSAGAFVLLGFPISMGGIISHLSNYNQPNVQCYIVRILWMVPIYSIESWLCLRFHKYAIYIETLRDFYESYVLYSFVQFLIQVLGGEEALILMLKDKSPTRGVHMWGMQWCIKPWLMGQPVRKTYQTIVMPPQPIQSHQPSSSKMKRHHRHHRHHDGNHHHAAHRRTNSIADTTTTATATPETRPLKRVHWKSPFFVHIKFGVLQYVLLKFVCSVVVMILERNGIYKEGDFTPKGGYLYICILTNLSQCWALYCLIFFYYATKNELAPINPVGKFLSVKALVFFTWWQSVCISILYQMDLIPHYYSGGGASGSTGTSGIVQAATDILTNPLSEENALLLDEHGGASLAASSASTEWTSEDVAKGLQDYLICIEMFIAAIVHTFVFPHSEYSPQAVEARSQALNQTPYLPKQWRRLGRKWKEWDSKSAWSGTTHTTLSGDKKNHLLTPPHMYSSHHHHHRGGSASLDGMGGGDVELVPVHNEGGLYRVDSADEDDDYLMTHPLDHVSNAGTLTDEELLDLEVAANHNHPGGLCGGGQQYYYHPNNNSNNYQESEGGAYQIELGESSRVGGHHHHRHRTQSSSLEPVQSEGSGEDDSDESSTSVAEEDDMYSIGVDDENEADGSYSSSSGSYSDDDGDDEDEEDDPMKPLMVRRRSGGSSDRNAAATTASTSNPKQSRFQKPNFVRALLDSTIPQDLRDNTVGIIKGDYVVEKKTLLHHAATSDSYELFSRQSAQQQLRRTRMNYRSSASLGGNPTNTGVPGAVDVTVPAGTGASGGSTLPGPTTTTTTTSKPTSSLL